MDEAQGQNRDRSVHGRSEFDRHDRDGSERGAGRPGPGIRRRNRLRPATGLRLRPLVGPAGRQRAEWPSLRARDVRSPASNGVCTSRTYIVRYGNNGRLDSSYGGGAGFAEAFSSGGFAPAAFAVDSAGRAIVAEGGENSLTLVRLDASGAVDSSFGNLGAHHLSTATATNRELKVADRAATAR